MNAPVAPPPFPTNPNVGDTYCGWMFNGSQWVCTQGQGINIQTFPGSGAYTPSPGLIACVVECVGGGGGGGGATATGGGAVIGWLTGGGGGSSGRYARTPLSAALVRGGVIITVGTGGAAGAPAAAGGPGGATQFGALCVAPGGNGGFGSAFTGDATPVNLQGGGGSRNDNLGVGQVQSSGNAGLGGGAIYWDPAIAGGIVTGGLGGMGFFGGAAQQARANGGQVSSGPPTGTDAGGYWGSGGGGGATGNPTTGAYGTPGGSGVCIVTEYLFSDFGGGGCCGDSGQARVAIGWQGGFDND
jgi:hypothetical protein